MGEKKEKKKKDKEKKDKEKKDKEKKEKKEKATVRSAPDGSDNNILSSYLFFVLLYVGTEMSHK